MSTGERSKSFESEAGISRNSCLSLNRFQRRYQPEGVNLNCRREDLVMIAATPIGKTSSPHLRVVSPWTAVYNPSVITAEHKLHVGDIGARRRYESKGASCGVPIANIRISGVGLATSLPFTKLDSATTRSLHELAAGVEGHRP
jgi:hypothetical protein